MIFSNRYSDYAMEMAEDMMEKFGASDDVMEAALEKARIETERIVKAYQAKANSNN